MKSNFTFLQNEFPEFYDRASRAEQWVKSDPRASLLYARMALEWAIDWMYTHDDELEKPYDTTLKSLMVNIDFRNQFNHKLYSDLHIIRKIGNLAAHNRKVTDIDSHTCIDALFYFTKWFIKSYAQEEFEEPTLFDYDLIPPKEGASLSKKELEELQKQFDKEREYYRHQLKEQEEKRKKDQEENELLKLQMKQLQAQINANKQEANQIDEVQHPRNEAETRKTLIDLALREAGWDLDGANDREYKVTNMPTSTNPSGVGYVDYVLWDDDGLPLAVVEAKKSIASVTQGENQAQLYAECLEQKYGRKPLMYYTNGYETFLWDDQFYKQARKVYGFYTKEELQRQMFRRKNRKDIRTVPIDEAIAGRYYQMRAIRSIAEHFAGTDKRTGQLIGTHRGALLVLATGTGKTRTAIAFSKLLLENNWAKRILFLADRVSLVKQAKNNFTKHLPDYANVNLLEDKDNHEARIAFSTYQTMMGLIDGSKVGEARFYGVGHFDLIIIDEAHRSIYKKYQAIFEYFDALFLGLTATPVQFIDRNTYEIFGLPNQSPTDAYTFDQAVKDKYLSPYHSVALPTKFMTEGIKYSDLTEEEKEQFEQEILDGEEALGDEWVSNTALNQWLFNRDTAIETLQYVLKYGIKKQGGDELGKTIIFARNQKHAHFLKDILLELDPELFGNEYVKVITHSEPKSQEFIERFCDEDKDRDPQIAISVDMMDTGIDAVRCVNLVFYKPVKSYAKFWQMIGRGSRLCPNLFGEGQDKTHFMIFDLCGNFEFFDQNPKGITPTEQKGITEVLFGLRLNIAEYLKNKQFKDNADLQSFRVMLLDGLHRDIANLNPERFDVKMKQKILTDYRNREVWNCLTPKDIQQIQEHLLPLVKPSKGDDDTARFYDRLLYSLIQSRLEFTNTDEYINAFENLIEKVKSTSAQILKKTTIPEVKSKINEIQKPLEDGFWEKEGVAHLEHLREQVRALVKYMDKGTQRIVVTNFDDFIQEDKIKISVQEDQNHTVSPFKNNIHRLEKILRENQNHITIRRIRNGETITKRELQALEEMLFSNGVDRNALEKEMSNAFNMVEFITSLMGLGKEKVDKAFAQFINEYELNSVQIEFLETIKKFFETNGKIDPTKLYDAPFIKFNSMGVSGVFTEDQTTKILGIIEELNEHIG